MQLSFNFDIRKSSKRVEPIRLVWYGVLFFLGMWLIAPVAPVDTLTVDSVGYIVVCIVSCMLGTIMLKPKKKYIFISYDYQKVSRIYRLLIMLSFFAVVLRLFDIFVARGQGVGLDSFGENMDSLQQHESSLSSIIAALFYYVPFLPVFMNMIFPSVASKKSKILAFVLFCFIGIGAIITGSRNAFLDPLLLLAFLYLFTRNKIHIKLKNIVVITLLCSIFLMISSVLFIQRLTVQNKTVFESTESSTGGYSDKVPPKDYYINLMGDNENNPAVLGLLFAYAQTTQYAIHGLWEFPIEKENIDKHEYRTYGASTFWVIDKFLYKFGIGIDPEIPHKYNARPGIWSTFFQNWYMDFGWWGVLWMFVLGLFVKLIWNKIRYEQNIFYLPLLLFFMLVFMYLMQLNRFVGTGTYALVSFWVFALWATKSVRIGQKGKLSLEN